MTSYKLRTSIALLFLLIVGSVNAQDTPVDSSKYDEVRGMVNFYKYMLNTVGDEHASTRDKEVIITESYKKAFKGPLVQVEDDLLPDRSAIINKNIAAYLRDVDFFFQDIRFDFTNIQVQVEERENGEPYYKVSLLSDIDAITIEGIPYKHSQERYIEINEDEATSDLKIVSVYSTKISREKELRNWWESLSYGWTRIFKSYVDDEEITDQTLIDIASIDSLDLSGNQVILDLKPLVALRDLKFLNVSDTKIEDLNALRFAMKLEQLDVSNTNTKDVSALKYLEKLQVLDLSITPVQDISSLSYLENLKELILTGTNVVNFEVLSSLSSLVEVNLSNTAFADPSVLKTNGLIQDLNLSRTGVKQLQVIGSFQSLKRLDISETYVVDLKQLSSHPSLEELSINQTLINDLSPLKGIATLRKVYADNSGVSERRASDFMRERPHVVVITNSERVMDWWNGLSFSWKESLKPYIPTANPTKEDIIKLLNRDSLSLENKQFVDADPIQKFKRLRYLNISKNLFTSLEFLSDLDELEVLVADKLPVTNLKGLEKVRNLRSLMINGTIVENIMDLQLLNKLEYVELENTPIGADQVQELLQMNPRCVVIFETEKLIEWWSGLSSTWQRAFGFTNPTPRELHALVESNTFSIENLSVTTLRPLAEFINLNEVHLTNTGLTSLIDLSGRVDIRSIVCTNGPLSTLEGVSNITSLEKLDISNTAVQDLRPLRENYFLKSLNCSGTNVKKLKGVTTLKNLEYLNISNTRVWQLDRLYDIRTLKTLVCYNTRIRDHKIEEFKTVFPECEVTYY